MAIEVTIETHTGDIAYSARLSETAQISLLINAIIERLNLPKFDASDRPISYHLSVDGKRLDVNKTLESEGIRNGSTITVVPEMTAGGSPAEYLTLVDRTQDGIRAGHEITANSANERLAVLRCRLTGHWSVADLSSWLLIFNNAYERINVFEGNDNILKDLLNSHNNRFYSNEAMEEYIRLISNVMLDSSHTLYISKIRISSPGIIEFIGSMNPLKVLSEIIIEWKKENTIRHKNELDAKIRMEQIKNERLSIMLSRVRELSRSTSPEISSALVKYAVEEPKELLTVVARDVRLTSVEFLELPPDHDATPS